MLFIVCYNIPMVYSVWTLEENEQRLIKAVQENKSIAGVCRSLGLAPKGGNIATMKFHIARLELDVSHHTGQAWNKDNYAEPSGNHIKATIKKRLIREYGHKCWRCGITEWNSLPAPLEMDHIDGNNKNNELSNLRILCPNCHAQTPTFRNAKRTA